MLTDQYQFRNIDSSSIPPPVPPRRRRSRNGPSSIDFARSSSPASPARIPSVPHRSRNKKMPAISKNSSVSPHYPEIITSESNALKNVNKGSTGKDHPCPGRFFGETDMISEKIRDPEKESMDWKVDSSNNTSTRVPSPNSPASTQCSPPYFTYDDYKMVMEGAIRPQILNVKYNVKSPKKSEEQNQNKIDCPFAEDIVFNDVREEIYFRITTTDRPFEKCLEERSNIQNHESDDKSGEESNSHIFEDYMDRSNRLNTRPNLLFSDDFKCITQDTNHPCKKTTTRVRFLIEAPSTDTPDLDLDDDGTSYGAFVDRHLKEQIKSTVEIAEVADKEPGEIDESPMIHDQERVSSCSTGAPGRVMEERITNTPEYATTSPGTNKLDEFCSEWDEDEEIYDHSHIANIEKGSTLASTEGKKTSSVDRLDNQERRVNFFLDRKSKSKDSLESPRCKEILNRKKVLIDASFYELSDENADEWKQFYERKITESSADESVLRRCSNTIPEMYDDDTIDDESRLLLDDKEKEAAEHRSSEPGLGELDASNEVNHDRGEELIPERSHRNSFLETMLDKDETIYEESFNIPKSECPVIVDHTEKNSALLICSQDGKSLESGCGSVVRVSQEIFNHAPKTDIRLEDVNHGTNRSAGEVKGDVLNELLTNFSNIKLKSISDVPPAPTKKIPAITDTRTLLKELTMEEEQGPEKVLRDHVFSESCSDCNDAKTKDIKSHDGSTSNSPESTDISKKSSESNCDSSGERHRTSQSHTGFPASGKGTPCENLESADNKVMTSLMSSRDQSEVVPIKPGSVKSFVKYYEIHTEISNIARIEEDIFKNRKISPTRNSNAGTKSGTLMADSKKSESSKKNIQPRVTKSQIKQGGEGYETSENLSSSQVPKQVVPQQKQSCLKNSLASPKLEERKSVQFDSGCEVGNLPRERMRSPAPDGKEPKIKNSPSTILERYEAQTLERSKEDDQSKIIDEPSAISTQDLTGTNPQCARRSGNRSPHHIPKMLHDQTVVFYCTL